MEESRAWRVAKPSTGSGRGRKGGLGTVRNKNKRKERKNEARGSTDEVWRELGEKSGCLGILPGGESIPRIQYRDEV